MKISPHASESAQAETRDKHASNDVLTPSGLQPPHALDGSQYHNIIEEQAYAEQAPSAAEQRPWRIFHPDAAPSSPASSNESSMSVGIR